MEEVKLPRHIGFIMDGNGRWAKKQGKIRSFGHRKGADILDGLLTYCYDKGIKAVSMYAFSTENWSRPKEEIDVIFDILRKFLKRYKQKLIRDKVRFLISGDLNAIPETLRLLCEDCMEATSMFSERFLNLALNYGSRAEIVKATNDLIKSGKKEITEEDFSSALYTSLLPDIDLVIRTSGEQRLSNFFLWQCAYSELYFTDVLWPDFTNEELDKAIEWYNGRGRRFGGI